MQSPGLINYIACPNVPGLAPLSHFRTDCGPRVKKFAHPCSTPFSPATRVYTGEIHKETHPLPAHLPASFPEPLPHSLPSAAEPNHVPPSQIVMTSSVTFWNLILHQTTNEVLVNNSVFLGQ